MLLPGSARLRVAEARATSSSPSIAVCLGVPPAARSVAVPPLCLALPSLQQRLQPAQCGAAGCWDPPVCTAQTGGRWHRAGRVQGFLVVLNLHPK